MSVTYAERAPVGVPSCDTGPFVAGPVVMRTPVYDIQKERGGRFIDFGGWEMPVQFTGVIDEHLAVRGAVGLFDVSHMGEVRLTGKEALLAVQALVTQDISKLAFGEACYTLMCLPTGGIVDDLIVYREGPSSIFLAINATTTPKDVAHIERVCERFEVRARDVSSDYALLAVQGPRSNELLAHLVRDLPEKRFSFVDTQTLAGLPVRVARTGYTGELGVEIFVAPNDAAALFLAIEAAGQPLGLKLCGLGARDSLRLEKKMPLYGNDIDESTSPLEAGLSWAVKLDKGEFVGRAALVALKEKGLTRKWVGFKMDKMIPRHGYPVLVEGREAGPVTSGLMSPSLKYGIGCAYVPIAAAAVGQPIEVVVREKPYPATVVKTPFL